MKKRKVIGKGGKKVTIKIEKAILDKALHLIEPAVSKRAVYEELQYLYFLGGAIAAYDGSLGVIVQIPNLPKINKAVHALDFSSFMKKSDVKELTFTFDEKESKMKVDVSKRTTATFPLHEGTKTQEVIIDGLEKLQKADWVKFPKETVDGIVLCSFSTHKDLSLEAYRGVYVDNKRVLSTDAHRVSMFEHSTKRFKKPILIPAETAVALRVLKPSYYSSNGKDLFLKSESMQAFGRVNVMVGEFGVDMLTNAFENWNDQKKYALPKKELVETLERTTIFVSQDYILDRSVCMILGDGITVSVERKEKGSYEAQIKTGWKLKEQQEIYINPDFMLEALRHGGTEFGISSKKVGKAKGHLYISAGQFKHMIVPSAKA